MVASPVRLDRAPLPSFLTPYASAVQAALTRGAGLGEAVREFCSAAFARPETAGAGSSFLLTTFARSLKRLAEVIPMEALAGEFVQGPGVLCPLISACWDRKGQTDQLAHLADAIMASGSEALHEGQKAEFLGALAASLAILQPQRAEGLLACVDPKSVEAHKALFNETREWLNAGKLLVTATESEKSFWQQELRSRRRNWIWDTDEARSAVGKLKERHPEVADGDETLIHRLIPSWAWNADEPITDVPPADASPPEIAVAHTAPAGEFTAPDVEAADAVPSLPAQPTAGFAASAAAKVRLLPQRRRASLLISGALVSGLLVAAASWVWKSGGDTASRQIANSVADTRPLETAAPLADLPTAQPPSVASAPTAATLSSESVVAQSSPSAPAPTQPSSPASNGPLAFAPAASGSATPAAQGAAPLLASPQPGSSLPLTAVISELPVAAANTGDTQPISSGTANARSEAAPRSDARSSLEAASSSSAPASELAANPSPPSAGEPPAAAEPPAHETPETIRAAQPVAIKRAKRNGWVETPFGIQFPVTPDNSKDGRITDPNGLVWQLPEDPRLTARVSGDHEVINPYSGAKTSLTGDRWSPGRIIPWADTGWSFKLPATLVPTAPPPDEPTTRQPTIAHVKPKPPAGSKAEPKPKTAGKTASSTSKSKRTGNKPAAVAKKSAGRQPSVALAASAPPPARASSSDDFLSGAKLHPDYASPSSSARATTAGSATASQRRNAPPSPAEAPPAAAATSTPSRHSFVTRSNNIRMNYKGGYWESEPGAYLTGAGETPERWSRDMTLKERSSGTIPKDFAFEVAGGGIVRVVPAPGQ